jgi:hypothetical protein
MATVVAKKSGSDDNAIAKNDDHHDAMANDPTIISIPQGSAFGSISNTFGGTINAFSSSSGASAFGSPESGGFGSTGSSSSATPVTTGFGGGSSFGAATPVSGNTTNNTGAIQVTPQNQSELLKSSGGAIQEGAENQVPLNKDATDWINKKMRPMMGWIYMLTCTCDFVIFPILWSLLQALSHGSVTSQWQPLTLQGAGLYHIAMGAVLGIAAYGRTKEKVAGVA